ncbi:MAG: tetratricopeptide repeat protein [Desulfonatronovibrionaceae bacterium]
MADIKRSRFSRRDLFKGFMRHVRGRWEEDQASGLDPEVVRGDSLLREKKYSEAAKCFEACLDNEPEHVEALQKMGYCLMKQGDTRRARQIWARLLSFRPGDQFSILYTGLCLAREGQAEEAVRVWKKYFNISHPHIQREINLILAHHERGVDLDPGEMVRTMEEAIARQKKSAG